MGTLLKLFNSWAPPRKRLGAAQLGGVSPQSFTLEFTIGWSYVRLAARRARQGWGWGVVPKILIQEKLPIFRIYAPLNQDCKIVCDTFLLDMSAIKPLPPYSSFLN